MVDRSQRQSHVLSSFVSPSIEEKDEDEDEEFEDNVQAGLSDSLSRQRQSLSAADNGESTVLSWTLHMVKSSFTNFHVWQIYLFSTFKPSGSVPPSTKEKLEISTAGIIDLRWLHVQFELHLLIYNL